ncbi:MAG TPA: hypothetical protein VF155_10670 [Candidatus Dormibacteraeota bacterium]
MTDQLPPEADLDSVVAALRADAGDVNIFFQVLASKLADSMPGEVQLEREGGMFKKDHPVRRITVSAGDDVLEAELRHGTITAQHAHAVRGIRLRTEQLGFDAWLRRLVEVLSRQSQSNAAASAALRALVT